MSDPLERFVTLAAKKKPEWTFFFRANCQHAALHTEKHDCYVHPDCDAISGTAREAIEAELENLGVGDHWYSRVTGQWHYLGLDKVLRRVSEGVGPTKIAAVLDALCRKWEEDTASE